MPNDPMFQMCSNLYDVVPNVLLKTGKVRANTQQWSAGQLRTT